MSKTGTYLLEIGCEELPVSFLQTAGEELKDKAKMALSEQRLSHGALNVMLTPRRIALRIDELALAQEASESWVKGPPAKAGLDDKGGYTQAAQGFAKKNNIAVEQLEKRTIDGVDYLGFQYKDSGRPVSEVLADILPGVVLSLSGSHFMTWDESNIAFSRPIRWILSLMDKTHVPLIFGKTPSGTLTYGNRLLADETPISIGAEADYEKRLADKGKVFVCPAERKAKIQEMLNAVAQKAGATIPPNEDLLETVTMLVETPMAVEGGFDPDFLELPKEVITTVMAAHQKYFPLEDKSGKLKPSFITISNNNTPKAAEMIRHGNEKVLRARLEDANFFYKEDTKQPLLKYVEKLEGIMFQKGLGSLAEKTARLQILTGSLCDLLNYKADVKTDAQTAAQLSKADLATNMVRELTELQGVVGKEYALKGGESQSVAAAIEEHYHPRFSGDTVAQSPAGIALSLADKLDTLLIVFAQKDARIPTGSKDPMGLRRMALGVITTVLDNQLDINLEKAFETTYQTISASKYANASQEETLDKVRQFLTQRLKGYLLDQQFAYDTIDAVLEAGISPWTNLHETMTRLKSLKTLQQDMAKLKVIYEPANRTSKILGNAYNANAEEKQIDEKLLEVDAEKALLKTIAGYQSGSPEEQLKAFATWSPSVEAFFNDVMVNAENPKVKENRYLLLSVLNKNYRQFADFTKLVVS